MGDATGATQESRDGFLVRLLRWVARGATIPVWVIAVLNKVEQVVGAIGFGQTATEVGAWVAANWHAAAGIAASVLNFGGTIFSFLRLWYARILYPPLEWLLSRLGVEGSPLLYDSIILAITFLLIAIQLGARAYEAKRAERIAQERAQQIGDEHDGLKGAGAGLIVGAVLGGPIGAALGIVVGGLFGAATPSDEAVAARQAAFDSRIAARAAVNGLLQSIAFTAALAGVFLATHFLTR